nr:uncharacterized protein LOC123771766 [Procambarus clarkii]
MKLEAQRPVIGGGLISQGLREGAKRHSEPRCQLQTSECRAMGGRCSLACTTEEEYYQDICSTRHCFCCVTKPRCQLQTSECRAMGGRCSLACTTEEEYYQDICSTRHCFCCVTRPSCQSQTRLCQAMGGRCSLVCDVEEDTRPYLCSSDRCSCCVRGKFYPPLPLYGGIWKLLSIIVSRE